MAMPTRTERKATGKGSVRWWKSDDARISRDMQTWSNKIEATQWARRFDLMTFYRYLTGRPTYYSYNYSSVSRPTAVNGYARARWTAPVKNIIGMSYRALNNRVYKNRIALQVCPDVGNQDARDQSKQQTRYLDAINADGLWPLVEECGFDASATGSGFLKIDNGLDEKTFTRTVVKPDEIIVDPSEAAINCVTTMVVRLFVNRYSVIEAFPDCETEIMAAPPAELGFCWDNSIDTTDVIVLRQGYHLGDADDGVMVLSVGDKLLRCKREKLERFPLAKLIYMPLGYWGKGGVEDSLPLQRAHNRMSKAIEENLIRYGWPRVGIIKGSGVNEGEIAAGSSMFFHHNPNMAPNFINPQTIPPDQFNYLENLERGIKNLWGLSDQAIASQPLGPDASGRARLAQDAIDDRSQVQLLQHLEDFVEDIGYLTIAAAEKTHPKAVLVGRARQQIDYPSFSKGTKVRAFPMSQIPQSIAGRQDWIDRAYAEQRINKETKNRLEGMPDIDGEIDLLSANADQVTYTLDQIVEKGEYVPPMGVGDLQAALEKVQTRLLYEQRHGLDEERISLLFQFLASVDELIADATPPPPVAPAGPGSIVPGAAPNAPVLPAAFPH